MVTRRQVIKTSAIGGTALLVPAAFLARRPAYAAPVPGGTLNPAAVPKYLVPLSAIGVFAGRTSGGTDFHDLAARQFNQQILPPGLPSRRCSATATSGTRRRSATRPGASRHG